MAQLQQNAVQNHTATMLEIGTSLLSQTAEQTRKLTDVETQVCFHGCIHQAINYDKTFPPLLPFFLCHFLILCFSAFIYLFLLQETHFLIGGNSSKAWFQLKCPGLGQMGVAWYSLLCMCYLRLD